MISRKNIVILAGLVLSISLLSASVTAALLQDYYGHAYTQVLGQVCQSVIEHVDNTVGYPSARQMVLSVLKEFRYDPHLPTQQNILFAYGYRQAGFLQAVEGRGWLMTLTGAAAGGILFLTTAFLWHRKETVRIEAMTDYLEKVNTGRDGVLVQTGEDAFSKLQDEIYKTVTALHQARNAALKAKENYAENLYNIAHQLKTPITSISLSLQLLQEEECPGHAQQEGQDRHNAALHDSPVVRTHKGRRARTHKGIQDRQRDTAHHISRIMGQLSGLTRLEEALLLLARIDAGTLTLERKEVDVFTLLVMSAENLQEFFWSQNISVEIPEAGEKIILADRDWTMEAVMNLLKNCMEHTPSGGTVHCTYEQNPLYTLIQIRDNGPGFAREDIPRLFERFYRGKNAADGGIGIGLALSREIIERQNGTLLARNLPEGGACFEIRFYCH